MLNGDITIINDLQEYNHNTIFQKKGCFKWRPFLFISFDL